MTEEPRSVTPSSPLSLIIQIVVGVIALGLLSARFGILIGGAIFVAVVITLKGIFRRPM